MLYDFLKIYLKYLKSSGKSPKTISTYTFALQKYNNWRVQNNLLIKEVGRDSIINFRESLIKEGFKPATINLCLNVVYSFYEFLTYEGYIKGNPVNIKKNKVYHEHRLVKPFTTIECDQIEAILMKIPIEMKMAISLLLYSGISIKEIVKLTPSDVVLIKRHIFLKIKTSTKSTRLVPIIHDETARELLILIIDIFKEFRIFHITENSIIRYINFVKEQIDFDFSYKRIRKNYSTNLLNSGCPRELLRWILGYRSNLKVSPEDLFPFTIKI